MHFSIAEFMNSQHCHIYEQINIACRSTLQFDGAPASLSPLRIEDEQYCLIDGTLRLHYAHESRSFHFHSWEKTLYPHLRVDTWHIPAPYPTGSLIQSTNSSLGIPLFFGTSWDSGNVMGLEAAFLTIENALSDHDTDTAHALIKALLPSEQLIPRVQFAQGVLEVLRKRYEQAQQYFYRAAQGGFLSAYHAEQQLIALRLKQYYGKLPALHQALQHSQWEEVFRICLQDRQSPLAAMLLLRALRELEQEPPMTMVHASVQTLSVQSAHTADTLLDYWSLLLSARRDHEALAIARLLFQLYPLHHGSYRSLCISYLILGRFAEARKALSGILLNKQHEKTYVETLLLYEDYSQDRTLSSIVTADAHRRNPHDPELFLYAQRSNPDSALNEGNLLRCMSESGEVGSKALLTHCDKLLQLGQETDALKLLRTVLAHDEHKPDIYVICRLSTLLRVHQRPDLALELWNFVPQPEPDSIYTHGACPLLEYACTLIACGMHSQGYEYLCFLHQMFPEESLVQETYDTISRECM